MLAPPNLRPAVLRRPVPGCVCTARQVLCELELDDSPSWGFWIYERRACIQSAHLTDAELLSVPGFADTEWTYVRRTHEWVPVFNAVDSHAILACVDAVLVTDLLMRETWYWVTPRGFPRDY